MRKQARKTGRPAIGILASAIGLLTIVSAGPAGAADWSLKYNTTTDLEFNDNLTGVTDNKDFGLKLSTQSSLDLLARTKTQLFRISPAVTTRRTYMASYDSNYDIFPSLGIGYNYDGKRTSFGIDAYVAQAAIRSDNLLIVNGQTVLDKDRVPVKLSTENGNEFNYGANIFVARKLTLRDTITWNAGFAAVDYSIDTNTLDPNTTVTSSLNWQHNLTKLISTTAAMGISYYRPDKHAEDDRITYSPSLSLNAQLTKRFSGTASAGLSITDPSHGNSTVSAVGSLSGTYQLKRSKISASVSRDISNATDGDLRDRYSAQLNVTHSVNDLMTLTLAAGYAVSPIDNEPDEQSFFVSPALNYQLSKDWTTSLSYTLSEEYDGQTVWTNAVLFNVSYGKNLLK
jgi:hypothetical protein